MPQLFEFNTIEENIKIAKELNLDFIELNLNFSCCRREIENGNFIKLLKKYNICISLHFYDEADFGTYQEVVDAYLNLLKRYLKLCKNFVRSVNIHNIPGPIVTISGVKNYIYSKDFLEYKTRLVKNLKKAEKLCNRYGAILVIENTEALVPYMEKTYKLEKDEGFKFCYDCGHDLVSLAKLSEWSKKYNIRFYEFHIHDSDYLKCHLPLGTGKINLVEIKKICFESEKWIKTNDINNEVWINLEVKNSQDLVTSVDVFRKTQPF